MAAFEGRIRLRAGGRLDADDRLPQGSLRGGRAGAAQLLRRVSRPRIEALHNPPEMYGFVAATKVDENFMSQVLEHVFLANGVSIVDEGRRARRWRRGRPLEVLDFYKAIAEASPPGELYWDQSRTLYFSGNAAMIIWSPFILDELAGLRDDAPPTITDDPTSSELASKTGIVTNFSGPSNPGRRRLGRHPLFRDHQRRGHRRGDGVRGCTPWARATTQTLSIAPEGKFPVRRGTADDPAALQRPLGDAGRWAWTARRRWATSTRRR